MNNPKLFFNITGPVIPGKHYLLPLRLNYEKVLQLIDFNYYFILHAPRQTGKTSAFLSSFSYEEVQTLYSQHTQATGQIFTEDAIQYAFDQTQGQPWLVNALGFQVCVHEVENKSLPITKIDMMHARDAIILRRDTHLDVLIDRLKEERVAHIIDAIISGKRTPSPFPSEDVKYATDLGLISEQNGIIQISNPIYKEVIPRELTITYISISRHG